MRDAGSPAAAVLALSVVGGLMLVAADFLELYSVHVMQASCTDLAADPTAADACRATGGERHA